MTFRIAALLIAALGLGACHERGEPRDMRESVAEMRRSGMSERAASDLRSLAAIRAHTLRLDLSWDAVTKTLSKEYVNLYCPAPGADESARAQLAKAAREKVEAELPELRRWADLDHSGFVSSEEAGRFRQLVEFHWADAYLRQTIGLSAEQVRATMGLTEANYRRLANEYSALGTNL